ncbi:chromosome segregation in meiosis- protein [Arthrobotrys musiformis]|uniref:Chromosome segregation in meiosis protein n=1 Tax=Arthrobotrys musiformis TaxID=47236 RepID=A0AAV9W4W0_9PEZI
MSDFDLEDDDEFDELFNYDIDKINTTFDANKAADEQQATTANKGKGNAGNEDLGVDEEVKIRARKPKVKLTEERLLGPDGIPYLQEHAAKKIKFKGKGHEISDLERLLKFYQIWADNLYPKAQFKDAIEMIEKMGGSRGMQRRREEWIEEFKANRASEDDRLIKNARAVLQADGPEIDAKGRIVLRIADPSSNSSGLGSGGKPGEVPEARSGGEPVGDSNVSTNTTSGNSTSVARNDKGDSLFFEDDDDDDLDELNEIIKQAESSRPAKTINVEDLGDDDFDELDAIMRDMEETSAGRNTGGASSRARNVVESDDEFEDAMAAMREMEG